MPLKLMRKSLGSPVSKLPLTRRLAAAGEGLSAGKAQAPMIAPTRKNLRMVGPESCVVPVQSKPSVNLSQSNPLRSVSGYGGMRCAFPPYAGCPTFAEDVGRKSGAHSASDLAPPTRQKRRFRPRPGCGDNPALGQYVQS